jgi:hypothetical protein
VELALRELRENRYGEFTTITEFEVFRELRSLYEHDFKRAELSEDQLYFVQNFLEKTFEQIEFFQTLDDEILYGLGYTYEQIGIIRNFEGTDQQIEALSAGLSVRVQVDNTVFTISQNRTSSRIHLTFAWDRVPLFGMTDLMAVGWDTWLPAGRSANVRYRNINNPNRIISQTPTFIASNQGQNMGGGFRYRAKINDNHYFAFEGSAIFVVDRAGFHDMYARGSVAHVRLTVQIQLPTFSALRSGNLGQIILSMLNVGANPLILTDSDFQRPVRR